MLPRLLSEFKARVRQFPDTGIIIVRCYNVIKHLNIKDFAAAKVSGKHQVSFAGGGSPEG